MFTASRFSSERTESRTRSTNVFTAFSLTRRPGGTISRTTGVEASASRKGRGMQARMGPRSYLNVLGNLRRPGKRFSSARREALCIAGDCPNRGEGMGDRIRRRALPFPLHDITLRDASAHELEAISERMGLALSVDEMRRIQMHFQGLGRDPTEVELQSLGQAWSEHCCYKSSKVILKEFIFPVQAPYVIDRGDAGVVEFDEDHAYALRIESHNHPSAIEPYGGANTGIGGILRDVLAMGAQPIALADPLHFGRLDYPLDKLSNGAKHPKYLFGGVVAGIRDYGNRVGIPTVAGCIVFDEGYLGNIVVNVACVGFGKKSQIVRNRVGSKNAVFILGGGRTGRDGIHGGTYASVDLTDRAVEGWEAGAVQLGDPILKEPLIQACVESAQAGLLDGLKH